jgi:hypothetical protein
MKQTDYNDFADKWILLNHEVKKMHNQCLKSDWQRAGECAEVCATLSQELIDIFKGYDTK